MKSFTLERSLLQTRLLALAIALLPLTAAADNDPYNIAPHYAACKNVFDDNARLACYDAVEVEELQIEEALMEETVPAALDTAATTATPPTQSAMAKRLAKEEAMLNNPFVIIPHDRNYILPVTYNSSINETPWRSIEPNLNMDDIEAKFQISFKSRLKEDLLLGGDLWAAYTQQNWWQVYNSSASAPFRETNYEPQIMMVWDRDQQVLGLTNTKFGVGLNHQSNGRGNLLSRSWNRIVVAATFDRENFSTRVRAWYRVPEDEEDDDNPDMDKYYGYGDLRMVYKWHDQEFSTLLRNNLRGKGDNNGAIQLDWTLPLNNRFRWYIQYFHGYGESLIDYNVKTNRIGIGFTMNDLL
ncbi:phospholipase A [Candidatus Litorirhabdus singularis]|nr:phospholipase A [Candidatus Litorirhabdus singularis]